MAATFAFGNSDRILKGATPYKVPKSIVVLACVACIAATVAVGFTWGGWVTSSKASAMVDRAVVSGQAQLAAAICVDRFTTGPKAKAQTALLKATEPWRRNDFMRQGGWLALPGRVEPVSGAAGLCVQQILNSSGT
jgi:predicted RNA polymerase sigma factor